MNKEASQKRISKALLNVTNRVIRLLAVLAKFYWHIATLIYLCRIKGQAALVLKAGWSSYHKAQTTQKASNIYHLPPYRKKVYKILLLGKLNAIVICKSNKLEK